MAHDTALCGVRHALIPLTVAATGPNVGAGARCVDAGSVVLVQDDDLRMVGNSGSYFFRMVQSLASPGVSVREGTPLAGRRPERSDGAKRSGAPKLVVGTLKHTA